ncbi:MAG: hypothetical protein MnENMB40S_14380 [Rhizobiaceae bacterium MnEN-MB40S]|nr:MAG: hypothetical protein MnENMB40S_14380 [Rhizobiaceae bacterium MnEN-MB40S]
MTSEKPIVTEIFIRTTPHVAASDYPWTIAGLQLLDRAFIVSTQTKYSSFNILINVCIIIL